MPSTFRNIIIFLGIAMIFASVYIFYFKNPEPEGNFVVTKSNTFDTTTQNTDTTTTNTATEQQNMIAQNFLSILLNVKDVQLDGSIFSDKAFIGLRDSTITIDPDQSEGRPNPFARFGADSIEAPVSTNINTNTNTTNTTDTNTNTNTTNTTNTNTTNTNTTDTTNTANTLTPPILVPPAGTGLKAQ